MLTKPCQVLAQQKEIQAYLALHHCKFQVTFWVKTRNKRHGSESSSPSATASAKANIHHKFQDSVDCLFALFVKIDTFFHRQKAWEPCCTQLVKAVLNLIVTDHSYAIRQGSLPSPFVVIQTILLVWVSSCDGEPQALKSLS